MDLQQALDIANKVNTSPSFKDMFEAQTVLFWESQFPDAETSVPLNGLQKAYNAVMLIPEHSEAFQNRITVSRKDLTEQLLSDGRFLTNMKHWEQLSNKERRQTCFAMNHFSHETLKSTFGLKAEQPRIEFMKDLVNHRNHNTNFFSARERFSINALIAPGRENSGTLFISNTGRHEDPYLIMGNIFRANLYLLEERIPYAMQFSANKIPGDLEKDADLWTTMKNVEPLVSHDQMDMQFHRRVWTGNVFYLENDLRKGVEAAESNNTIKGPLPQNQNWAHRFFRL